MSGPDDRTLISHAGTEATLSAPRGEDGRAAEGERVRLPRGTSVGRYVVLEKVGSGGMGVVFAAYDPELDRKVALKLVRTREDAGRDRTSASRLIREAQAMAKLSHANVIVVHDVGTFADGVFIAMEYLDGGTLTQWMRTEVRPVNETLRILCAAGEGLAAAHAAGIVHRDFKPDNVLLGRDGRVRVLDFGLARSLAPSLEESGTTTDEIGRSLDSLDVQLTATGARVGTPAYMSPEQHLGHTLDARSDQFSFCVAAYLALYGHRPFDGESLPELTGNVLHGRLREPDGSREVPAWVLGHLQRGLQRDPQERFESMRELLDALSVDVGARRRRSLRTLGAAALVIGTTAGVGSIWLYRQRPCREGRAKMKAVWSASAREAGRSAFGNAGREGADTQWAQTAETLEAYASRWTQMYDEACRATHVEEDQSSTMLDRRMHCLERRRTQLHAVVELFAEADATVVDRAGKLVARLDPIDDCANIDALLAQLDPPAPEIRGRVAEVTGTLVEVGNLRTLARFGQAAELLTGLEPEVDAINYPPTSTEYLYYRSAVANDVGDVKEAETFAYATIDAAAVSGHDVMAADAWISLAIIVGITRQEFDLVEPILHGASAGVTRLHSDKHRARLLSTWGTIDIMREDFSAAEPRLREALDLFIEVEGADSLDTIETRERLALVFHGQARFDEAQTALEAVLAARERVLDPEHPQVAQALGNLGRVYKARGKLAESLPLYERSLAIFTKKAGARHPIVATTHHNLSNTLRSLHRYAEAEAHLDAAQELEDALFGPDSESAGHNRHARGLLQLARDRNEDALASFDAALEIWRATLGATHVRVAYALTSRARALIALDRLQDAVAPLEEALVLRAKPDSAPPNERALTHFVLARTLWDLGRDRARALKLASTAKDLFTEVDRHDDAAEVSTWILSRGS